MRKVSIVQTPRGPVEVAREGSGPCLLIIHGVPGSWRQSFMVAEDLSDRFTVVTPSRPGYGETPLSSGRTPDEQADLFADMLDELGIGATAVAGASGGGPAALSFSRRHPERTRALVLACAMSSYLVKAPPSLRFLIRPRVVGETVMALQRPVTRRRLNDPVAVARWMKKDLTADEMHRVATDPRIREDLIRFARTHLDAPPGLAGLRNDFAQVERAKAEGPPAEPLDVPALILHGDADKVIGMDQAHFHATMIPRARLHVFEGAGHVFLVTRRREMNDMIRSFLTETMLQEGHR